MANPYHDAEGKFTSRDNAGKSWNQAVATAVASEDLEAFLAAKEKQEELGFQEPHNYTSPLSNPTLPEDKIAEFEGSVIRDEEGNLLPVFHGTSTDFGEFSSDYLGRHGQDAYGAGFYFTGSDATAESYGAVVKQAFVNIQNPIRIDGTQEMGLTNLHLTAEQVKSILSRHPAMLSDDEEEVEEFFGDYVEEYWDNPNPTVLERKALLDKMLGRYFKDGSSWVNVEGMFTREGNGKAWVEAVKASTGHDGVVVDFGPDIKPHVIAWFPEQIAEVHVYDVPYRD